MAHVIYSNIFLCSECTVYVCNSDLSSLDLDPDPISVEARTRAIVTGVARLGGLRLSLDSGKPVCGVVSCDGCKTSCDTGTRFAVMNIDTPAPNAANVLRHVRLESPLKGKADLRILTWRDGSYDSHHVKVRFAVWRVGEKEPFFSSYYGPAPSHDPASDESLVEAVACLAMKPGDTDQDYFDSYTHEEMAWAESHECEALQMLPSDAESSEAPSNDGYRWDVDRDGEKRLYLGRKRVFKDVRAKQAREVARTGPRAEKQSSDALKTGVQIHTV